LGVFTARLGIRHPQVRRSDDNSRRKVRNVLGDSSAIRRFVEHLNHEWTALFSFLFDVEIEATNYRAEHAIRWAVVTRKMCGGGNRTTRGAVTQYVLASVLRTARQRGLDRHAVFVAMLRAPTSIVSPAFQRALDRSHPGNQLLYEIEGTESYGPPRNSLSIAVVGHARCSAAIGLTNRDRR
jgi:hypothetical protein